MSITRDTKGRFLNSRRRRHVPTARSRRYVVTTVGSVPDDVVAIVSRAHAEALAMASLGPIGTPGRGSERGPETDHSDEEQES